MPLTSQSKSLFGENAVPRLILQYKTVIRYESGHDKTYKWHVRPANTQISLASAHSDQSLCCPHEESLGP